jgi:hypothetical protein
MEVGRMPEALYGTMLAAGLIAGAYLVFVRRQGDCDTVLEVTKAHNFALSVDGDSATVSCLVPLTNRGRQDGMVVELLGEPSHPGQVPGRPRIVPFARPETANADNSWYWRALLIRRGQTVTLRMGATITFPQREADEDVLSLVDRFSGLILRVHCKTIGRRSITWRLSELAFPWETITRKAA